MGVEVLKLYLRQSLQTVSEINAEATKQQKYYLGQRSPSQTFKEYSLLLELQSYRITGPEETSAIMWPNPILVQEKYLSQEELKGHSR